jgi:hypothetical protein
VQPHAICISHLAHPLKNLCNFVWLNGTNAPVGAVKAAFNLIECRRVAAISFHDFAESIAVKDVELIITSRVLRTLVVVPQGDKDGLSQM